MKNVINLNTARKLRNLYNDYLAQGGRAIVLTARGRTQGKSLTPAEILELFKDLRRGFPIKGVGGNVEGSGATILPFKRKEQP